MPRERRTDIVSHRGANGYVPEHTIAAYTLAIDLKADYIEPDLVLSRDGVFFAMHDILLDYMTNISEFPEFANRSTTREIEGSNKTGLFVSDFTAKELKLLRVNQRMPDTRGILYDKLFEIPTLTEIFQLIKNLPNFKKKSGIYMELKYPEFYLKIGFNMGDMILSVLTDANYSINSTLPNLFTEIAPVVIECFIPQTLIYLRNKCNLPLVQLVGEIGKTNLQTIRDVWNIKNLDMVMKYANGLGPDINFFTDLSIDYEMAISMIKEAHSRGLVVHPWEIRVEPSQVSERFHGNSTAESYYLICCLEVDGLFTDFPDDTYQASVLTFKNPSICSDMCPSKFLSINTNQKNGYVNEINCSLVMVICKKMRNRRDVPLYDNMSIGQSYDIIPKQ